jgi:hypothetical protein
MLELVEGVFMRSSKWVWGTIGDPGSCDFWCRKPSRGDGDPDNIANTGDMLLSVEPELTLSLYAQSQKDVGYGNR